MCGIAGFTRFIPVDADAQTLLGRMNDSLEHRGPDAAGQFLSTDIALCHRRLSILDLTEAGSQPMSSHSGRYVMVYNGEVYNFQELRKQLVSAGVQFRGHSDTEVLLALYESQGIEFLSRLNGMFALAIWDTREKSLVLARDRLGKKPLYFYHKGGSFLFASEIKAILCAPNIDTEIRLDALQDYFNYQYVPDPKSIYKHVHKLAPGHWLKFSAQDLQIQQYWDVSFSRQSESPIEQAQEELLALLMDSVRLRMVSDVPVGAFLSGGVDSSAIVALMAAASSGKITTCSIGFDSREFDEVQEAQKTAGHFATDHHEMTVKDDIEKSLPEIAAWFDEPFADPSFVPTFHVAKMARQKVTVALTGDGGDESFAGYSKYISDRQENTLRSLTPDVLRQHVFPAASRMLASSGVPAARRASSLLGSLSVEPDQGYAISNSFFRPGLWNSLVVDELRQENSHYDPAALTRALYHKADTDDHLSRLLYVDLKSYLPGDVLVKVDRMSMANSLEARAPLLDYRIVEFAASLPSSMKLREGKSKYILKNSVAGILPPEVLTRRKTGFSVPLANWLRHEIRDFSHGFLFARNSGLSNFFQTTALKRIWLEHQSGKVDYSSELWSLLMFELWWQRYQEKSEMCAP